ncbi:MAG TPA: DUF1573 domain-containing protein [Fimbriimonas sp.]|nr:DUF1573 domain-containing protein [Fimbriimonas sp.]
MRWLLVGAVLLAGCSRTPVPKLEVLDGSVELGEIRTEELQQKTVRLKNSGSAPLHIRDVVVSCGCTRPEFPRILAAGESGEMRIEYQPDLLASGTKTDTLKIISDDPTRPEIVIPIHSELRPPIIADQKHPLSVTFTPGNQKAITIRFRSREPGPPPIAGVEVNDPRAVVGLRDDGEVSEVAVIVGASPDAGDYDLKLILQTRIENVPILDFPIVARTESGPFASPSMMEIHKLRANDVGMRLGMLTVMCRGGTVKVKSVRPQDPSLAATIEPAKDGRTWIPIVYKGGWKPGAHVTSIQIVTDHPKWPVIQVPVVVKSVE